MTKKQIKEILHEVWCEHNEDPKAVEIINIIMLKIVNFKNKKNYFKTE